jgi:hypothetical protein
MDVVEINDLDIPANDPAPIELEMPVAVEIVDEAAEAAEVPVPAPPVTEPLTVPAEGPALRRSTRVRFQTKKGYVPSVTGSRYAHAVTQLENRQVLNPDAHMFVQEDFTKPSLML